MTNKRSGRKRVEVGESIHGAERVVRNASRSTRCDTSKDVKPPWAEQEWHNRLTPIYLLLQQVKNRKKEIAGDDNLYEDLLVVLGVELITSLRQVKNIKPGKPPAFKSAWKQHIRLALDALGPDADYKAVANWVVKYHPNSRLPSYCNPFLKVTRDLFELIVKFPSVAEAVDRDVSYVRVRVNRWMQRDCSRRGRLTPQRGN
jgi:hypothetical protein